MNNPNHRHIMITFDGGDTVITHFDGTTTEIMCHYLNHDFLRGYESKQGWVREHYRATRIDFLDSYSDYRICTGCGKVMTEGYYLGGEYACCDGCAILLYHGATKQLQEDLEAEEAECGSTECYWTEWI